MEEEQLSSISQHSGFPNPATDTSLRSLDLNQLLIQHSASTYYFRIQGNSWEDLGIFNDDLALVDRSLNPKHSDLVVWWNEEQEQFSISLYRRVPKGATIWAVVTSVIHQYRKVYRVKR